MQRRIQDLLTGETDHGERAECEPKQGSGAGVSTAPGPDLWGGEQGAFYYISRYGLFETRETRCFSMS